MKMTRARVWSATAIAMVVTAGLTSATVQANASGDETRWSATTQMSKADRDRGAAGTVSQDEFPALATQQSAAGVKGVRGQSKSSGTASRAPNTDFWFYDADVVLFNDNDQDGYYHGIDLLFDADTYYDSAEVYAVVYLSLEGGPWNEYAVTDNFLIFGASADDEYVVVSELVSGYPTGSYDLLIELFDTWDNSFVASFGPADTSELAFLQLEDAGRDAPQQGTTVIVREGGGGAFGAMLLLPLLLLTLRNYWQNWARNGLSRRLFGSSWRRVRRKKSRRLA